VFPLAGTQPGEVGVMFATVTTEPPAEMTRDFVDALT